MSSYDWGLPPFSIFEQTQQQLQPQGNGLGPFPSENYGAEPLIPQGQPSSVAGNGPPSLPSAQGPNPAALANQAANTAGTAYLTSQMMPSATPPGISATEASLNGIPTQAPSATPINGLPGAPMMTPTGISPVTPFSFAGIEPATMSANMAGVPFAVPAGIATGTYLGARGIKDAIDGKKDNSPTGIGSRIQAGISTGGISEAGRALLPHGLGGGKGGAQRERDGWRSGAQEQNILNENYEIELPSGNLDLGRDMGSGYRNSAGGYREPIDIDWENDPNAGQAVGWLNPIADILTDGNPDLRVSTVGQLYNELTKDGTTDIKAIRQKVIELYQKFNLTPSTTRAGIQELLDAKVLSQADANARFAAIDNLRPGRPQQVAPAINLPGGRTTNAQRTDPKRGPTTNSQRTDPKRTPDKAIGTTNKDRTDPKRKK